MHRYVDDAIDWCQDDGDENDDAHNADEDDDDDDDDRAEADADDNDGSLQPINPTSLRVKRRITFSTSLHNVHLDLHIWICAKYELSCYAT